MITQAQRISQIEKLVKQYRKGLMTDSEFFAQLDVILNKE